MSKQTTDVFYRKVFIVFNCDKNFLWLKNIFILSCACHKKPNEMFLLYLQLSGGLQIFFGASFAWNHLNYSLVLGNNFWIPSTILLCLGPVTYLLCWLGWNAVSKRNRNYLKIVRNFWFSFTLKFKTNFCFSDFSSRRF